MVWSPLLLVLGFAQIVSPQSPDPCNGGFALHQMSCYAYIDSALSWQDAQSTCHALGGFMAEIYDDETNKFIQQMVSNHSGKTIWLGADDLVIEGKWFWAKSGAAVSEFSDWAPNQPDGDSHSDENCMEMNLHSFGGHWNDDECDHHQRFICQKYPPMEIIG